MGGSIVQGDFRKFDSRYDVVALAPTRTRIDYRATLDPTVPVPPLFGIAVMRSLVGVILGGVLLVALLL